MKDGIYDRKWCGNNNNNNNNNRWNGKILTILRFFGFILVTSPWINFEDMISETKIVMPIINSENEI